MLVGDMISSLSPRVLCLGMRTATDVGMFLMHVVMDGGPQKDPDTKRCLS
jgi:hypothetical protein